LLRLVEHRIRVFLDAHLAHRRLGRQHMIGDLGNGRGRLGAGAVTRQITPPTSSLTRSAPSLAKATQVGRPWALPSLLRKPVSTGAGGAGSTLPWLSKRTKTTS
jgi:hypothetical protein